MDDGNEPAPESVTSDVAVVDAQGSDRSDLTTAVDNKDKTSTDGSPGHDEDSKEKAEHTSAAETKKAPERMQSRDQTTAEQPPIDQPPIDQLTTDQLSPVQVVPEQSGNVPSAQTEQRHGEEPVAVNGEQPVAVKGEEPITVNEEEPVAVNGEELVAVNGEQPVDVNREEPVAVNGEDPDIRGDEESIVSDEVKGDEKPAIPDDFFYDYAERVSKPKITESSGLPADMLMLHHSFGYDCMKRANLCMLDSQTLAYVAGNLVQFLDLQTQEQKYLRSTGGGAVGAITVHPSRKYLAVAEKGDMPDINVYEYPSLKLYRILKGGTQQAYAFVCFSPDGKLLASVGGDPDYMLTLWDWKQEVTVLRSKAFSQDVFRVSFSTELEGQLTSAGTGHIRFWKMAHTFTGLKLQGQLGKFGKTEISDIEGYVELPDGKVLSGSENGNMLLWDGGLIKVEITRKGKKPCHSGPIQQIIMEEGELMTVGQDGCIRVWDFETIDTADSTDDSGMFEMEPMNEIKVGQGDPVSLRSIIKSVTEDDPTIWYAQDANGNIWKLDLSFSHTSAVPERLMHYHAGQIAGCSASPVSHLVATTGTDRTVRVHDYLRKVTVCESLFQCAGTSILWAPKMIDPKGATILVGFDDGVVRTLILSKKDEQNRKGQYESELVLSQVFKPHVKAVVSIALDSYGETLATASQDGTVFFFSVGETFMPIGFVEIPGPSTHISWSPSSYSKNLLLVCCANGFAQEIECPEPGVFDTSHSYQIKGVKTRTHQFKSIKSQLRHDEEMERKRIAEEQARKKKEEERRLKIERGLISESDDEEETEKEEEKKEEEEEWKPYIPAQPSAILYGFFSAEEEGRFWLSLDDFDAGYLYQCQFREESELKRMAPEDKYTPTKTLPVDDSRDVPISTILFSDRHQQALLGMQDGVVRIQPLAGSDISSFASSWQLAMHDNQYGEISAIGISHNGVYIITVGRDGNFFVYNYMSQKDVDAEVAKSKLPSAFKLAPEKSLPDDIDDPQAYSIEDAKQKAEHDKMMKEAEERKQEVRRIIAQLRRQFKKLLEKNSELPQHLRLNPMEFEMDPEIKRELQRHTQDKIDAVKKELAWESEKQRIALDKLKQRYKATVECERIVVKSFKSTYELTTFRAAILTDEFFSLKVELEDRRQQALSKANTDMSRDASLLNVASRKESVSGGVDGQGDAAAKQMTNLKGSMGQRIQKALQKVENKKKKRAARKAQWDDLFASKPNDDYEDPEDVAAIKAAQENMGDYKLKTAVDYVVPDHLRMNVEKAIMKLLILKDLIHETKYRFNQKVLSLRDKKLRIIDDVTRYIQELASIVDVLGEEKAKPLPAVPKMHPEELPERKMEYTRESLLAFKTEMERQAKLAKVGGEAAGGFGGFGGGGGGAAPSDRKFQAPSKFEAPPKGTVTEQFSGETLDLEIEKTAIVLTPLEQRIKMAEAIRLTYQQDFLLKKIEEMLSMFDAELHCLYFEKLKLNIELKNADLRYITLFEEFLLLKEYEKHENTLGNKVAIKQLEKVDQQNKSLEINQKIELKKKEIEKLQEKEKALHAMFVQSLGESNKFADYLTKVFKKKIKRSKKKENAEGEDGDDESEEESDDDEDWEESDEESGSEGGGYDLDICPPGCDQQLYTNTCQLREKRLDIEEILNEEKKNRDQLIKDAENMSKKTKVIMAALKSAEADLEAFQLEKQQKLNEIDIVVTMKLHQILHNENGHMTADLSQCLVFQSPGLVKLSHRITELEHEKAVQKKQQKEAKKTHVQLIKDRKLFEAKINELAAECNLEMELKFGRLVELEDLEQVTVNRQVEELKEKLRMTEIESSEDLKRWEDRIRKKKEKITSLIQQNTNRIETLNMLQSEKRDLQSTLDSKQKSLGGEFSGTRKSDIHERQRLVQLVQLQAQEVDALKEEIVMLSHKGGHILPPAQPPLPSDISSAKH